MQELKTDICDFKTEMQEWLKSQEGELATEAKLDQLKSKRHEIIQHLESWGLTFLLNPNSIKTDYMWDCYMSISELLMQFDLVIQRFEEFSYSDFIAIQEDRLRLKMEDFDKKLGIINE